MHLFIIMLKQYVYYFVRLSTEHCQFQLSKCMNLLLYISILGGGTTGQKQSKHNVSVILVNTTNRLIQQMN